MKTGKNKQLMQLLNENNNIELKKWLISNGKARKPYCPIMFNKDTSNDKKDEEGDNNG